GVDVPQIQIQIAAPKPPEAPVPSPAAKALSESEQHFQQGRSLLEELRVDEARHEFDLAVDGLLNLPEEMPDRAQFDRKAEALIRQIHKYDLESLGAGQSPEGLSFTQSPRDELPDLTFPVDPSMKDKVLERIRAASSQLPLEVNEAVLGYINFFTSPRGQRVFLYGWKRAGRYRAMIERVLREEGLPAELIHLAQAESASCRGRFRSRPAPACGSSPAAPAACTAWKRAGSATTGWIPKRRPAPRPATCSTCTTRRGTGTWRWRATIAGRCASSAPSSAPATRTIGNCDAATCCRVKRRTTSRPFWPWRLSPRTRRLTECPWSTRIRSSS